MLCEGSLHHGSGARPVLWAMKCNEHSLVQSCLHDMMDILCTLSCHSHACFVKNSALELVGAEQNATHFLQFCLTTLKMCSVLMPQINAMKYVNVQKS